MSQGPAWGSQLPGAVTAAGAGPGLHFVFYLVFYFVFYFVFVLFDFAFCFVFVRPAPDGDRKT